MGKISQGILGGFSGKVGTVIGGTWKGINYMRSRAPKVKNSRTEKQMLQRNKFAATLAFLQPITGYVRVGYKSYANGRSAFNAAMSYISRNAFTGTPPKLTLDYASILVARGTLLPPFDATATAATGKVNFTWTDNSFVAEASDTDLAMPLLINISNGEAIYDTAAALRSEEALMLSIPTSWSGDTLHAYLAFIDVNAEAVSNSAYLGSLIAI